MSEFEPAIEYVLENEGGLVENPSDPGGITNFGLSFRFLSSLPEEKLRSFGLFPLDKHDLINLMRDKAKLIYKNIFWDESNFDKIDCQDVCNYVFDMSINLGISPAIKNLQRACWSVLKCRDLVDDGIMSEHTLDAVKRCGFMILPALRSERAGYYRILTAENHDQKEFLQGWLNRAYESNK